jgi:hypothetical protein
MPDQVELQQKVEALTSEQADQLLRQVFRNADLNMEQAPATTVATREAMLEAIESIEPGAAPLPDGENVPEIIKQSLQVIAFDPILSSFITDKELNDVTEKPKHFGIDATSFLSTTTLALVVLSTYINIKRNSDGKWTFQFRIKNSSEGLKTELIKLAKKLISLLPNK